MKLRNKKTGIKGCIEYVMRTIDPITCEPLLTVRYKDDAGTTCYIDYETVAEFNENWEDVKQPLIKDEEVRNIVRLWAKYHNADILRYLQKRDIDGQYLKGHYLKAGLNTIDIDVEILNVGMFYTIEELCGDEE